MTNPKVIHQYMYKVTRQFIRNTKSLVSVIIINIFFSSAITYALLITPASGVRVLQITSPALFFKPSRAAELNLPDFTDSFCLIFWDFGREKIEYNWSFLFLSENELRNETMGAPP